MHAEEFINPFVPGVGALCVLGSVGDICKENGREAACPGSHSEPNGRCKDRQDKHVN